MADVRVDIGLPVFNGAGTIRRALDGALSQTFSDFRLTIADNASTDGTGEIIADYARRDQRIRVITQPSNLGAFHNYLTLLRQGEAEFFVYLPADDWWSDTFLAQTLAALTSDPDAVCCVPRTGFYNDSGTRLYVTPSTSSITYASARDRSRAFLRHPSDCARFYGVHRRTALSEAYEGASDFHACDWFIMLQELRLGTHLEVPFNLLHRTGAPPDRYARNWRQRNKSRVIGRTPLGPMRTLLRKRLGLREYLAIRPDLKRLDARLIREYRADERLARDSEET